MHFKDIKNWSSEIEKDITNSWKKSEIYAFDPKKKQKIYSIDTPPPYINAPIHIGHAATYAYMDMFARYKRMKGFQVIFPLGLDRNGLPIEMGAEKKFGVSALHLPREKFLEYCEKLLEQTSLESTDSFAKLGISFTSYKIGGHIGAVYLTDSSDYRALTQTTFIDLYKKGLIYEASRINNWDPKLQTTIADSEIDYKDIHSTFNDIKWKVKETGEEIIIGTTRPELICTCGMVIFNPKDKRYLHLEGKTAFSPLFNKPVPIKSHPLAQIEKGTGLAMMCSAGDLSDIQFFREMNIKPVIAINKDGTMNQNAGFLVGLKVKEARQKIIETIKENNLLVAQTQITHRTPVSERSGAEIEFIEMPEFYLKQLEFKPALKKITDKIDFYPPESRKILDSWMESISIDWPLSRRRFYATSVPLWYSEGLVAVPAPGRHYLPWKEAVPKDAEVYQNGKKVGKVKDFKDANWIGETRVLDTWFDSSISELYILKYKENPEFFKRAYPATLRPQGKEIVRTWLYYTILRGYLETGKPCFEEAWIHQHILDEKGRKMSKSLGNAIDPQKILKDYGSEAFRFWAAIEGDLSKQDLSCSKEKIKAELKTLNKILNVAKFITQFKKPKKANLTPLDQLFVDYINSLTQYSDECYDKYDFYHPSLKLREFLWETFASHYLEVVKSRAYNQNKEFSGAEADSARYALYYLLERFLALIYPVIPQITSIIGKDLGLDLLNSEFPTVKKISSDLSLVDKLINFNKEVWKAKKDKGISLREPLKDVPFPIELKPFEKDLRSCHNLQ